MTAKSAVTALCSSIVLMAVLASETAADQPVAENRTLAADDPILSMLEARVARDPGHSDSWRLIGKLKAKRGNQSEATAALMRALKLDPNNAAAHFDLGQLLLASGNTAEADHHFARCVVIAPYSDYAEKLCEAGLARRPKGSSPPPPLPAPASDSSRFSFAVSRTESGPQPIETQTVGYEIQTFDGAEDFDRRFNELKSDADPTLDRLRVFLETGVLYNSNVSLTPISRGLAPSAAESYQGIFNPEVEWIAVQQGLWRGGPLGRGFFAINESTHSEFDLASFQPGAFLERDFTVGSSEWISRLEYVYALDLLDGDKFGDRHSITASVIMIRPDLDVIYTYVTTSFAEFADDGADPAINSLDGPAISGGVSRFFQTDRPWIPNFGMGIDLESVDADGADFRYRSVAGHGDLTCQIREQLSFVPSAGVGYRDYYSFTGPVDRNELIWRVQGKLNWQVSDAITMSLVAGHNRFASDNEDFDSERTEGGTVLTYTR